MAGLLTGAFIVALTGSNPARAYYELLRGALWGRNIVDTLNWAVPLTGMALATAVPLRGGMVNLGGDGQLVIGGLAAALVAVYVPVPGALRVVAALAAASASSGLYALLAAWGEQRWRVPMLISTLLLNYPAVGLASFLVRFAVRDGTSAMPETPQIEAAARLVEIDGTGLTSGVAIIVAIGAALIFFDRRTVGGFELRIRGQNVRFAEYGGVDLQRQALSVMFCSGAMAGLVGAIVVTGLQYRFTDGALLTPGYTWSGLMAALLARGEPAATIAAALFFSILQIGGFGMERATAIPKELGAVLQATIIVFMASCLGSSRKYGA
ncbi:ABC transporter permease [Mesorhizobium koreense]|uniref:ABC transporter permease n=1 Tax=Mesorhizobium koreense TaxID=3074855 RepID=UPI00287BAC19|nr:ABC transporter permease [Mesorhizobium sp. WR6]